MQILHQVKNRVASHSYELIFLFMMILFTALTKPPMLFDQFMWAEMATNYFKNAHLGFFEQLMVTDYGYLQFTQRFITYIGHILQIPTNLIPYFYNWSSLMMIFLILVPFISSRYEVIIREKSLRLAVVIIIFLIADFESINFISFSYFGLFLLLIESIRLYWTKKVIWYDYLLPFLFLSKPILLIFYPIYFVLLCHIRNKEFLAIFILISALAFLQINTAIDYVGSASLSTLNNSIEINSENFIKALSLLLASLSKIFLYGFIHNFYLALIFGFLLLVYLFKNFNQKNRINLFIILVSTYGGILFNVLVLNNWQQPEAIYDRGFNRQNIFIYMNYILVIGIIINNIQSFIFFSSIKFFQKKKPLYLFLIVIIFNLLLPLHILEKAFKINKPYLSGSSAWKNITNQDFSEYCYSINPNNWLFSNTNCKQFQNPILKMKKHRTAKYFSKEKVNNIKIRVPRNSLPTELMGFKVSITYDEIISIYNKPQISCELFIFDDSDNLLAESSKIFMMRSGTGNIEFNFQPILLSGHDYMFELSCNKYFYYDNAQTDQVNYFVLGKS